MDETVQCLTFLLGPLAEVARNGGHGAERLDVHQLKVAEAFLDKVLKGTFLPCHSYLLRCCCGQQPGATLAANGGLAVLGNLVMQLHAILALMVNGLEHSTPMGDAQACSAGTAFVRAFLLTQPLHVCARVLALHSNVITSASHSAHVNTSREYGTLAWRAAARSLIMIAHLAKCTARMEGAAAGAGDPDTASCCVDAFVESLILEHMCALRLTLADHVSQLLRPGEASNPAACRTGGSAAAGGHGGAEDAPAAERDSPSAQRPEAAPGGVSSATPNTSAKMQEALRSIEGNSSYIQATLDQLEAVDINMCATLAAVTQGRAKDDWHFSDSGAHFPGHTLGQQHPLWPCLQHPAVQCYLAWRLMAPGMAPGTAGQPPVQPTGSGVGGSARGDDLPMGEQQHEQQQKQEQEQPPHYQQPGASCSSAAASLHAAGACWEAVLRCGLPLGRAVVAGPGGGGEEQAAEQGQGQGQAAEQGAAGNGGEGHATCDDSGAATEVVLLCRPGWVFRVVLRALGRCQELWGHGGSGGNTEGEVDGDLALAAADAAAGALLQSVLCMRPAAAARRVPCVWRAVLHGAAGLQPSSSSCIRVGVNGWWIGQLLCSLTHIVAPIAAPADVARASPVAPQGPAPGPGPSTSQPHICPPPLPYVLSCGLEADLLPTLERCVRDSVRQLSMVPYARLCTMVDLALRRPGCWPGMVAHGDPQQVAALIVSLRKAAQVLMEPGAVEGEAWSTWGSATWTALRTQLLALLEQLTPQLLMLTHSGVASTGGAAGGMGDACGMGDASGSPGEGGGGKMGGGQPQADGGHGSGRSGVAHSGVVDRLCGLRLNRSLRGGAVDLAGRTTSTPSEVGSCPWPLSPPGSGPTWRQVEAAGGCPAPGTPVQLQQQRLSVLAAVEWLPVLLTYQHQLQRGGPGQAVASPFVQLVVPFGAHVLAWDWLRLVARQALGPAACVHTDAAAADGAAGAGGGGGGAGRCWVQLLVRDLAAVEQVAQVLRHACEEGGAGGSGVGGAAGAEGNDSSGCDGAAAAQAAAVAAAARQVLPAALDVLEVVVLVQPGCVLAALQENLEARSREGAERREVGRQGREARRPRGQQREQQQQEVLLPGGWGPGLPWDDAVRGLLVREGRAELVGHLEGLLAAAGPGGSWEGSVGVQLREGVLARMGDELLVLPGPVVDVGFPRCGYARCLGVEGESEAGVRLQACGRCRAVGYCSATCQRADWAAGHRAGCGRGIRGAEATG